MTGDLPDVIAIDGPAASGKGTIAEAAARALGFHYLDSGALYRLVALKALRTATASTTGRRWRTVRAGARRALRRRAAARRRRRGGGHPGGGRVAGASRVAVHGAVRQALIDRQRAFRRPPGLVADGRDMGTVVFPDARLKVFVTATAEERARRRHSS